ncbi:MAG: KamA family radical SAM protein [Fimbriimonadaceae bacterium]
MTTNISLEEKPKTVKDLEVDLSAEPLERLANVRVPKALKDPVNEEDIPHRHFNSTEFWKRIPEFSEVSKEEFLNWKFQNKMSVTKAPQLEKFLTGLVSDEFLQDVKDGLNMAPMNMRLSPYILSLVDWDNPYDDPLRRQFIPVASSRLKDHPQLTLDSLHEQHDSPTSGLVHRYPDKALFLPLDVCPVYCRFCTRSYAIGGDTEEVEKHRYQPNNDRWDLAFAYIASRPDLEDIVVSGGDSYMLSPDKIRHFGETLLSIPHIRRIRFATKGPAVMPMKILTHHEWFDAIRDITEMGREMNKEVCVHTHFNTVNEITDITRKAMNKMFKAGIKVRNQAVLIRGVNDTDEHMVHLTRKLSYMNVQPYYVYQHDLVMGVEELRTPIRKTVELEKAVRGATAGFNTPAFVCDVPGGGGKRDVHSYEYYDEEYGVAVYRSPNVADDAAFLYFDPMDTLSPDSQKRWADESQHEAIIDEVMERADMRNFRRVR